MTQTITSWRKGMCARWRRVESKWWRVSDREPSRRWPPNLDVTRHRRLIKKRSFSMDALLNATIKQKGRRKESRFSRYKPSYAKM